MTDKPCRFKIGDRVWWEEVITSPEFMTDPDCWDMMPVEISGEVIDLIEKDDPYDIGDHYDAIIKLDYNCQYHNRETDRHGIASLYFEDEIPEGGCLTRGFKKNSESEYVN